MHDELTAPAERHTVDRGHGRHRAITQRTSGVLELRHQALDFFQLRRHDFVGDVQLERRFQRHRLRFALELLEHRTECRGFLIRFLGAGRAGQICADRKRRLVLPDHQRGAAFLGLLDRALRAVEHIGADRMHLALEREHGDVVAAVPAANRIGLKNRRPFSLRLAQHRVRIGLALIDRQARARRVALRQRRPRTLRAVHAAAMALFCPSRQRHFGKRLAGSDIFADPLGDLLPACRLPSLERSGFPTETPADRQVKIASILRNRFEMHSAVVEHVAETRPKKLRLRAFAAAQPCELLGGALDLQNLRHFRIRLAGRHTIVALGEIEHFDVFGRLAVNADFCFLPERTFVDQRLQPIRRFVDRMPRIVRQRIAHGVDHMRERVQPDHIRCAECRALRPADGRPGQRIDGIEAQTELHAMMHRQHREHADAIGDEIGRVLGADDAFAERGGEEAFELIHHLGPCAGVRDQLHQMHVARRIEKMHATETRTQLLGQRLRQLRNAQSRSVAGDDRVLGHERRNALVQRLLPIHALGDRFDDEIALA